MGAQSSTSHQRTGGGTSNSSIKVKDVMKAQKKLEKMRTLDGRKKGLKVKSGSLKCKWSSRPPEVLVIRDAIRIKDDENNSTIEIKGNQDHIELGGFQMMTKTTVQADDDGGKKAAAFALGINTKQLNLATFEVEVQSDGTLILMGRKLKSSREGWLRLITPEEITAKDVTVTPSNDNRVVWIQIYYEKDQQQEQDREDEKPIDHPASDPPLSSTTCNAEEEGHKVSRHFTPTNTNAIPSFHSFDNVASESFITAHATEVSSAHHKGHEKTVNDSCEVHHHESEKSDDELDDEMWSSPRRIYDTDVSAECE